MDDQRPHASTLRDHGPQVTARGSGIRPGVPEDAEQLTSLPLRARAVAMPWLRSPHHEASTRWWMEHIVLGEQRVRVVENEAGLLGFAAVEGAWLEPLYVDPDRQRLGIGRRLLDDAKQARPAGLSLHVFTGNVAARRFYEAAGFVLVDQSDGRRNEEQKPDCTYTWLPPARRTS
jgi:GNAT superfamily N-acetyltransferase